MDKERTNGQERALEQLLALSKHDDDLLEVVDVREPTIELPFLIIDIAFLTSNMERSSDSLPLRPRERLVIFVPPEFPFEKPTIVFKYDHLKGQPHIEWGRFLCLYLAPDIEWEPSGGMYDFIDRLNHWLRDASLGKLQEIGAPIHPPVAHASSDLLLIPEKDTPDVEDEIWLGYAQLSSSPDRKRNRLIGWSDIDRGLPAAGILAAVGILLTRQFTFEYPEDLVQLLSGLSEEGVSPSQLLDLLLSAAKHNTQVEPLFVVVGTPSRGRYGDSEINQHLVGWHISPGAMARLMQIANEHSDKMTDDVARVIFSNWSKNREDRKINWCRILEGRPAIISRRDENTKVSAFKDKVVSLFGLGALGGHVADLLVRAGVKKLFIRDNGLVTPGILVRQPFGKSDVGFTKAEATEKRLRAIADVDIDARACNILDDPLGSDFWPDEIDIVIDATASNTVKKKLEFMLSTKFSSSCPIASIGISHDATQGLLTYSGSTFGGGPFDVSRRAKIESHFNEDLAHFSKSFWPSDDDIERRFQPEPGCSEPTFRGSGADVASLASQMLNAIGEQLAQEDKSKAVAEFYDLNQVSDRISHHRFIWHADKTIREPLNNYLVKISNHAWRQLEGWISRSERLNAESIETGGILFGQVDEASRIVWISEVTGPPSDSIASETGFVCGTEGIKDIAEQRLQTSKKALQFIGQWHTHPKGKPIPSQKDLIATGVLLTQLENVPRKAMQLIIGGNPTGTEVGGFLFDRSDFEPKENPEVKEIVYYKQNRSLPKNRIALALSGGGSRAIAFHLGCLRALHDRGILDDVTAISCVSGGSVVGAMYGYFFDSFSSFEARVIEILRTGIQTEVVKNLISRQILDNLGSSSIAGLAAVGSYLVRSGLESQNNQRTNTRGKLPDHIKNIHPPLRRTGSRTTRFVEVLDALLFDGLKISSSCRNNVRMIINACELRTGTAFRFGSTGSRCYRYGDLLDNDVKLATAVGASAAYPLLLPALDESFWFSKNDQKSKHRVILTDGGVYDNLGITCLEPGRSEDYSTVTPDSDFLICCNAGKGTFSDSTHPYWLKSRLTRSFETTGRRVQDSAYKRLFEHKSRGRIKSFVHAYLGQNDNALPYTLPSLVPRESVVDYPTDFAVMTLEDIKLLSLRGEQLTQILLDEHCIGL